MGKPEKSSAAKWLIGGTLVLLAAAATAVLLLPRPTTVPRVCITQIASHPSLDEVRRGVIDRLADHGYHDGENIKIVFRNANGDPSLTLPIAQDFVQQHATVIVPITTPSALGAAKSTDRIPIVFGGVSDPKAVGLVTSLEHPGGNVTGTCDKWPYEKQVGFFQQLLPHLTRLGMLYTAGDDVATIAVQAVKRYATERGIQVITRPVSNASDVYPSAVAMLRDVDAIYTGMDNLVADNLEGILKAAREANKPVLAGDTQSVDRGALATWSISMYDLGRNTGDMVVDVLEGQSPAELPVRVISEGKPVVNSQQAERFGIPSSRLQELKAQLVRTTDAK